MADRTALTDSISRSRKARSAGVINWAIGPPSLGVPGSPAITTAGRQIARPKGVPQASLQPSHDYEHELLPQLGRHDHGRGGPPPHPGHRPRAPAVDRPPLPARDLRGLARVDAPGAARGVREPDRTW